MGSCLSLAGYQDWRILLLRNTENTVTYPAVLRTRISYAVHTMKQGFEESGFNGILQVEWQHRGIFHNQQLPLPLPSQHDFPQKLLTPDPVTGVHETYLNSSQDATSDSSSRHGTGHSVPIHPKAIPAIPAPPLSQLPILERHRRT